MNLNTGFQTDDYVYGIYPNLFLTEIHNKLQLSGDALAIAEEGHNAIFLAEKGMKVTTWDCAESALLKTRNLAEECGVKVDTKLVDLNKASWKKNQWDELVCIFGHFPTQLRQNTLKGIREAVKPGGYFITEVYSEHQIPYQSGGPKDVDLLYSLEEFFHIFEEWSINHFFIGEESFLVWERHNGLSHVIQFVGQKPLE